MREIAPEEHELRKVIFAVNQLIRGRSNATGTVTLTAGATSTVVSNTNFNASAVPMLFPRTANAAAALATTYATISTAGTLTIVHANAATVDRTFSYVVLGG